MSRFVERAMERAGLGPIVAARRERNPEAIVAAREALVVDNALGEIDLLALGAAADVIRAMEVGDVVRIHDDAVPEVTWVGSGEKRGAGLEPTSGASPELDLLRAVAIARVTGPIARRIGVDWQRHGLELAQVALGFGATDLMGPITRKNGLVIRTEDTKKVKGLGMVSVSALKRHEISALVRNAGRLCEFVAEATTTTTTTTASPSPSMAMQTAPAATPAPEQGQEQGQEAAHA